MKKHLLALSLVLSLVALAKAQPKLGLKFSPVFVSSRVDLTSDTLDIFTSGSDFKFSIGLTVDQELSDTYFLSTGVVYIPKHVSIDITGENGGTYSNTREEYSLQYLQIPITLKLFTNEIAPDLSIFFQVGAGMEFKIYDAAVQEEFTLINQFKPFDASVILGAGAEYRAGVNTVLYAGGSIQRGLLGIVKATSPDIGDEFYLRSGLISIDLGIKF
ncbi:MAG: PorT family protein [Cyclobacteriaceae bacterium]